MRINPQADLTYRFPLHSVTPKIVWGPEALTHIWHRSGFIFSKSPLFLEHKEATTPSGIPQFPIYVSNIYIIYVTCVCLCVRVYLCMTHFLISDTQPSLAVWQKEIVITFPVGRTSRQETVKLLIKTQWEPWDPVFTLKQGSLGWWLHEGQVIALIQTFLPVV